MKVGCSVLTRILRVGVSVVSSYGVTVGCSVLNLFLLVGASVGVLVLY